MGTCCASANVDGDGADDQNKDSETAKEPPKDPKQQQMELQKEMDDLRHRQSVGWRETPRGAPRAHDEEAVNIACAQLVAMGYDEYQCKQAAKYNKHLDLLQLIEWMESHQMSNEEIHNSKIDTICSKLKEVNITCHRLQAIHALDQLENETDTISIIDKAVQYITDHRNAFLHLDMTQKEEYMLRDQILMASVQSVAHKRQKSLEWDHSKPLLVADLRSMGFLQLQANKAVNDSTVINKKSAIKWIMNHPLTQEQELNAKVDEIVHFGFAIEEAIAALKKFSNNLDHSIIWLNQGKPYKINHYLYHVKTQKNVVLQNENEFKLAENINFENPYQKWSVWQNGLIKNFQCNKLCVIKATHTKNIRIHHKSNDDKKEKTEAVLEEEEAATSDEAITATQETTERNTENNTETETETNPLQESDLLSIVEKAEDTNASAKHTKDNHESNPFLMEFEEENNDSDINPFAAATDNERDEENKDNNEYNPFDVEPNEEEPKEPQQEPKEQQQEPNEQQQEPKEPQEEEEEVNEPTDIDAMADLLQFSLSAHSNEQIENDFFGENATKTEQSEIQNPTQDITINNPPEKVEDKGADNEAIDANPDMVINDDKAVKDDADHDAVAIEDNTVANNEVDNNGGMHDNTDADNKQGTDVEIEDKKENKEQEEEEGCEGNESDADENEIEELDDGKEDEITYELCLVSELELVSNNNAKIEYLQNWMIDNEERTIKMDVSQHNKNKKKNENQNVTTTVQQMALFDNNTDKNEGWYLYLVNRENRFILDTIFHEYDMQQRWCVLSKIEIQELNPKELAKELDDPDAECIICFDNDPNVVLNPCGHSNFCKQCIDILKPDQCPICRTDVKSILQQ